MQVLLRQLTRPWGLEQQIGLLARWLRAEGEEVRVVTRRFNPTYFGSVEGDVVETPHPWKSVDPARPTLVGSYPATLWARKASLENYSVTLPYLPWGLYPRKQRDWVGRLPSYVNNRSDLITGSLKVIAGSPFRWVKRRWHRFNDGWTIRNARNVFVYDSRLVEPVEALYDRSPRLLPPMAASGRSASPEPGNKFLTIAPLEPAQNLHNLLDAFSIFVHRLGQRRRESWEGDPSGPWEQGNITLTICGEGQGHSYLKSYAESQKISEAVEFKPWPSPEKREPILRSALGFVDLPLSGDASALAYHAMSMGVPAVYSRRHDALDSLLESQPLSLPVDRPRSDDAIAKALLRASQVPRSQRQTSPDLKEALSPDANVKPLMEMLVC